MHCNSELISSGRVPGVVIGAPYLSVLLRSETSKRIKVDVSIVLTYEYWAAPASGRLNGISRHSASLVLDIIAL